MTLPYDTARCNGRIYMSPIVRQTVKVGDGGTAKKGNEVAEKVEYYALRKEAPTIEFLRAPYAD